MLQKIKSKKQVQIKMTRNNKSVIPMSPKTRRLMICMTERKQVGGESRKGLSTMKITLQGPTLYIFKAE